MLSIQPGLRGSNDLCVWRKIATFQLFFLSREQVVIRRGQVRRIGWVVKTLEAQVGKFLLDCKCPVNRGIIVQEKYHLGELPGAFFLQNVLQFLQQRWVIGVDRLALWKIINEKDTVLIPNKSRRKIYQRIFASGIFWGGMRRLVATPLIVALSPSHSDITRIRPWSLISTGNHLDRDEKIPNFVQTTGTVDVFDTRSGISGPTSRRASACPYLHERWKQPAHVRCPVAQLLI